MISLEPLRKPFAFRSLRPQTDHGATSLQGAKSPEKNRPHFRQLFLV